MKDLAAAHEAVMRYVRDGAGVLELEDYDAHIAEAVSRLSELEPRRVVVDIAGVDGQFDYALPAPFDPELGDVLEVEYPAGRREPSIIDRLDWTLYASPAGTVLRLQNDTPSTGETVRVTHTAPHTLDEAGSTLSDTRWPAVIYLAAALSCEALAGHYSNAGDALIGADSADHKSKAREYAARGKRLMQLADDLLPAGQGETPAASGMSTIGEDLPHLTHPNR